MKPRAIKIAHRGCVIVHGKIAFAGGSAEELNNNELIRKFYLRTLGWRSFAARCAMRRHANCPPRPRLGG
jgi:hypothetical protein